MALTTITTVIAAATATSPAGPYDLTDLATAKEELSVTSTTDDNFLSRAITQASEKILKYCDRVFAVEGIQDLIYPEQDPYPWQTPGGVRPLQLSRWPLVYSDAVPFTGDTHGNATIDGISDTTGLVAGMPVFGDGVPAGTTIGSVDANAGSVSLLPSSVALAAATGVSFTTGVQVIQTLAVGQTQELVAGTDYRVDAKNGQLVRLSSSSGGEMSWEAYPTQVRYAAGYATVPADLQEATLRLVTARYRAKGRDPMLISRNEAGLGEARYWVGTAPGQSGPFPPDIAAILDSYRVPVTA